MGAEYIQACPEWNISGWQIGIAYLFFFFFFLFSPHLYLFFSFLSFCAEKCEKIKGPWCAVAALNNNRLFFFSFSLSSHVVPFFFLECVREKQIAAAGFGMCLFSQLLQLCCYCVGSLKFVRAQAKAKRAKKTEEAIWVVVVVRSSAVHTQNTSGILSLSLVLIILCHLSLLPLGGGVVVERVNV